MSGLYAELGATNTDKGMVKARHKIDLYGRVIYTYCVLPLEGFSMPIDEN